MSTNINAQTAFPEIALTLSGGGYRAAAFHLGALDCLKRLGLLDSVTMLSTVSGGTITGMMYAVSVTEGRSYEDFYKSLYDLLLNTDVIQKALDSLYTVPGAADGLSLIRSAAQVYADDIFGNKTLSLLYSPEQTRFKELIFNATEFRLGNSFRFQRSQNELAVIGNSKIPVERRVAEQTRLADIAAASSCFPGGFEPLRFPDDFQWVAGNDLNAIREMLGNPFKDGNGQPISVPLMDGGVYDNQGLDAIMLGVRRAGTKPDLIIVSDTNQRDDSIYVSPPRERKKGLTLKGTAWLTLLILILSLGTAAAVTGQLIKTLKESGTSLVDFIYRHPTDFLFLYVMPFLLSISVAGLLFWLRATVKSKQKLTLYGATFDLWPIVRRFTIPDLLDFMLVRVDSLLALTSSVFMKRIRGLVLSGVLANVDWNKKVLPNVLYEMNLNHPTLYTRDPQTEPSAALKQTATRAEAVQTKLWVSSREELHDLIACGQATMCFNVLKFLWEKRTAEMEAKSPPVYTLYQDALRFWKELKGEPAKYAATQAAPPSAP